MEANEIKKQFDENVDNYSGAVIDKGMRGAIIGTLEKACGRKEDRHLVLKFLTGHTSSRELNDAQWNALYLLVQPYKPEGGKWTTMVGEETLKGICNALIRACMDQPGQEKMFGEVRSVPLDKNGYPEFGTLNQQDVTETVRGMLPDDEPEPPF